MQGDNTTVSEAFERGYKAARQKGRVRNPIPATKPAQRLAWAEGYRTGQEANAFLGEDKSWEGSQ
jgi:ribosome modulation factor